MEHSSDGLRKAAPNWSLHGDQQLLQLLQSVHQKIIEKCQATNKNLDDMVSALDTASIHLQNVNNKFTALSNSQFIESRVYEDDLSDRKMAEKHKEQPEPLSPRPLDIDDFREGLSVLERMHETVAIVCDSDSDTASDDDDDGTRLVVKPKDLYASRPLPYIIGSTQWKRKWHAGLIPEDSDSESSNSDDGNKPADLYSDSDSERSEGPPPRSPTISTSTMASRNPSVDLRNSNVDLRNSNVDLRNSNVDLRNSNVDLRNSNVDLRNSSRSSPPSQSDIAAELARKLGAARAQVPIAEPEPVEPEPVVRKVYRPHQPTPGAIFPDEPPPIDDAQSEDSDHDIFAEIYKTNSYAQSEKDQVSVADDLFGKPIFDEQKPTTTKPIGAKSIFGSNANSDSIGAAILKRKSRHSSTSGDESDRETTPVATNFAKTDVKNHNVSVKTIENKNNDNLSTKTSNESQNKKERDIFDELFAKSEKAHKKDKIVDQKPMKEDPIPPTKDIKKVDLFSDNLFDDIDDIFTNNVKTAPVKEKTPSKSIFDDEDDDLFSDLAFNNKNKTKAENIKSSNVKDGKNLDFTDEKRKGDVITKVNDKIAAENKNNASLSKETKGLFDDSDDDIFSDVNKPKNTPAISKTKAQTVDLFSDDDEENLFSHKTASTIKVTPKIIASEKESSNTKKFVKSPDLFEDDVSENMSPKYDTKEDVIKTDLPENLTVNVANQEFLNNIKDNANVSLQGSVEKSKNDENNPVAVSVKSKTEHEDLYDDDLADDLFGKPIKSVSDSSNKEKIQESQLRKDKSNDTITKKDFFADNTNIPVTSSLDTKTTVSVEVSKDSESEKVLQRTFDDDQVNVSENEPKKTVGSTPEISIKPTVKEINVHTDVTQIDNPDELKVNKDYVNKVEPPNDFLEEINAPLPNTPKVIPDSKPVVQNDIFDDIFNDQPPAFEKPKEPKRSKNVNALFDDDSDDESLFLKKNDVITDERPEGFTAGDDRLFGLFRDEPPAVDVDFVQKSNKKDNTQKSPAMNEAKQSNIIKNIDFDDVDDDLFTVKSHANNPNQSVKEIDVKIVTNVSNIFEKDLNSGINTNISDTINIFEADGAKNEIQDIVDSPQVEPKKIGKLKSMNFNIDVNTLLPGASPKKTIKKEIKEDILVKQTDKPEDLTDEVDIPENIDSKMVKSVSFEGEPDSTVLDNKLSKERAKIKIKRRPSTRRARKEAARKSGIDFGEDVPDNSTPTNDIQADDSFEEHTEANICVKGEISLKEPEQNAEDTNEGKVSLKAEISLNENKIETREQESVVKTVEVNKESVTTIKSSNLAGVNINTTNEVNKDLVTTTISKTVEREDINAQNEYKQQNASEEKLLKSNESLDFAEPKNTNEKLKSSTKKEIKTKVVYVINDDDIFNTNTTKNKKATKTSIFNDFADDDDDIFSTIPVAKNTIVSKQANSGEIQISDETERKKAKDSVTKHEGLPENVSQPVETHDQEPNKIVELDKNIAISEANQNTKDTLIKTKTIDLDSDEELFKKVSKPVTNTSQIDSKVTKIVIFDNDDNLFKNQQMPVTNITKRESTARNVEKLSKPEHKSFINTSDDDDDNLFKINTKSTVKSKQSERNVEKEMLLTDSDDDLFKSNNKVKGNTKSDLETKQKEIDRQNNDKKKSAVVDLDDEFFKSDNKIKTIAQFDPQNTEHKKKIALDVSDDNLFKNSNKKVTKPSLFDSDSDEELFGGKQKTQKHERDVKEGVLTKKVEAKKYAKKTSLFGDDSDDDDLFGAAKKIAESKSHPAPSKDIAKETASVKTKSVLEDPLSMFDDND